MASRNHRDSYAGRSAFRLWPELARLRREARSASYRCRGCVASTFVPRRRAQGRALSRYRLRFRSLHARGAASRCCLRRWRRYRSQFGHHRALGADAVRRAGNLASDRRQRVDFRPPSPGITTSSIAGACCITPAICGAPWRRRRRWCGPAASSRWHSTGARLFAASGAPRSASTPMRPAPRRR